MLIRLENSSILLYKAMIISYDYASYPGAYSDYISNAPQDTIDTLCAPNCRNELTRLYQQCISNVSPSYIRSLSE